MFLEYVCMLLGEMHLLVNTIIEVNIEEVIMYNYTCSMNNNIRKFRFSTTYEPNVIISFLVAANT